MQALTAGHVSSSKTSREFQALGDKDQHKTQWSLLPFALPRTEGPGCFSHIPVHHVCSSSWIWLNQGPQTSLAYIVSEGPCLLGARFGWGGHFKVLQEGGAVKVTHHGQKSLHPWKYCIVSTPVSEEWWRYPLLLIKHDHLVPLAMQLPKFELSLELCKRWITISKGSSLDLLWDILYITIAPAPC